MEKGENSSEKARNELLITMTAQCGENASTKELPFKNEDVSKFLEKLDEFEKKWEQCKITFK